ncbi:MAG: FecR domain-containing protein [Bacteroidales bacterium]|nr:FecR domain-containing protein [Bacteroidales bacterium]
MNKTNEARDETWELIAKIITSEAVESDKLKFQSLATQDNSLPGLLEEAMLAYLAAGKIKQYPNFDQNRAWNKQLLAMMAKSNKTKRLFTPRNWLKMAASLALLASLGLMHWLMTHPNGPMITVTTGHYEKKPIGLPDGSLAMLNSTSAISYPSTFTGRKREIKLRGEAFFFVAPDKEKPFVVNTVQGNVQVLGTSFNIKEKKKLYGSIRARGKGLCNTNKQPERSKIAERWANGHRINGRHNRC